MKTVAQFLSSISLFLQFISNLNFLIFCIFFYIFYQLLIYLLKNRKYIKILEKTKDPETITINDLKNLPLVNIIVPAWTEGKEFRECLQSIIDLKYPKIKAIVNAGGNSETINIAESFKKFDNFTILHQKRGKSKYIRGKGKIIALNECLDFVSEGILYLIDADCYLTDDILLRLIYPITNNNENVVMGAGTRPLISQENFDLVKYSLFYRFRFAKKKFERYLANIISGANTCLTYNVIKVIGKFNENRLISEDVSRGYDIITKGFKVYRLLDYRSRIYTDVPITIKEFIIQRKKYIENKLIFSILYNKKFSIMKYFLLILFSFYILISPIFILFNIGFFYIGLSIFLFIYLSRMKRLIIFKIIVNKKYYAKFGKILFIKIFYYIIVELITNIFTLFSLKALIKKVKKEIIYQKSIERE